MTGPEFIGGFKLATLATSAVAACIAVAIEWRSYDLMTALGSIAAGMFVAAVATTPTLDLLGVASAGGTWEHAVAGAYAITGRNIMIWLRRISTDPPELIRMIFGLGKGRDK